MTWYPVLLSTAPCPGLYCIRSIDARLTGRKETVKTASSWRDTFRLRMASVAMGRMDGWRVNLLGRFELHAPNGQEIALGARKSIALIALLATAPGQRLARDRLA